MDVYVLDEQLRRIHVFDRYKSFIWTERYSAYGDFEMVIGTDVRSLALLTEGTRIAIRDSMRVMEIETVEKKDISGEGRFLTISGRSMEKILEERGTRRPSPGITTDSVWSVRDRPGNIIRMLFDNVCVNNTYMVGDNIPYIQPGVLFPPGTIPEPEETIGIDIGIQDLYSFFKEMCDAYNLGFRLIRNFDFSQLYFEVYSGNNLTTGQSSVDPVVFSPDLDNLADVTELRSKVQYKNVAYVFAKHGYEIVYAADASPSTAGFNRRVLIVNASDVDLVAGVDLTNALIQKGNDALSQNRGLFAFDGEVPQNGRYKYGTDYQLGDLVEMQNSEGSANWMRVTEQIFVSDAEGERSYPTLALDLLITPGAWFSWDYNDTWNEAEGTWDDAP